MTAMRSPFPIAKSLAEKCRCSAQAILGRSQLSSCSPESNWKRAGQMPILTQTNYATITQTGTEYVTATEIEYTTHYQYVNVSKSPILACVPITIYVGYITQTASNGECITTYFTPANLIGYFRVSNETLTSNKAIWVNNTNGQGFTYHEVTAYSLTPTTVCI
jgi:hypothetical protein